MWQEWYAKDEVPVVVVDEEDTVVVLVVEAAIGWVNCGDMVFLDAFVSFSLLFGATFRVRLGFCESEAERELEVEAVIEDPSVVGVAAPLFVILLWLAPLFDRLTRVFVLVRVLFTLVPEVAKEPCWTAFWAGPRILLGDGWGLESLRKIRSLRRIHQSSSR